MRMKLPTGSPKSIKIATLVLFLIGIVLLFYLGKWWPEILIVIGLPLAFKQALEMRRREALRTLVTFLGLFAVVQFNISWKMILTILFTMTAIYILCKEWFEGHFISIDKRKRKKK